MELNISLLYLVYLNDLFIYLTTLLNKLQQQYLIIQNRGQTKLHTKGSLSKREKGKRDTGTYARRSP